PAEWTEFEQHSVAGRWRSATASGPTRRIVPTSTHVFAARCSEWTPLNSRAWCGLRKIRPVCWTTHRLLDEARQKGWKGEVLGLQTMLGHFAGKNAQLERLHAHSPRRSDLFEG